MNVVIAASSSLSPAADLGNSRLAYIGMSAAWDAAVITFQASEDGVTWRDLYNDAGSEYQVTAAANRMLRLSLIDWLSIRYLKIRSGTAASPVNQTADRTLKLGLLPVL